VYPYDQYFRGSCYRYFNFFLGRRYTDYLYLKTWQRTELACLKDNATLVAINDEDEAYFIKVRESKSLKITVYCPDMLYNIMKKKKSDLKIS